MTKVTTYGLMGLCVGMLRAGDTDAEARVFTPGDWPTADKTVPYIRARVLSEHKQSWGKHGVNFTVTGVIRLALVVDARAQIDDAGAAAADVALQRLKDQVETLVIGRAELWAAGVQQFPTIDSNDAYDASGAVHVGTLHEDIAVEFVQTEDDFAQPLEVPLQGVNLYADLQNIFDATATYEDPPFADAVVPAPRTEGPDGRSEGALSIDLPQPE